MSLATKNVATATLSAAGAATTGAYFKGDFNAHAVATGFTGTIDIERSFDDGATWAPLSKDLSGAPNSFTNSFSVSLHESEDGVMYRIATPTRTAGSVAARLSQPI